MRTVHILLLCVLGAALFSAVLCQNGSGTDRCCFGYIKGMISKGVIDYYYKTDNRCPKAALIFVTKTRHSICVDPSKSWVKHVQKYLDETDNEGPQLNGQIDWCLVDMHRNVRENNSTRNSTRQNTAGSAVDRCCFDYYNKRINKNLIDSYYKTMLQSWTHLCNKARTFHLCESGSVMGQTRPETCR